MLPDLERLDRDVLHSVMPRRFRNKQMFEFQVKDSVSSAPSVLVSRKPFFIPRPDFSIVTFFSEGRGRIFRFNQQRPVTCGLEINSL